MSKKRWTSSLLLTGLFLLACDTESEVEETEIELGETDVEEILEYRRDPEDMMEEFESYSEEEQEEAIGFLEEGITYPKNGFSYHAEQAVVDGEAVEYLESYVDIADEPEEEMSMRGTGEYTFTSGDESIEIERFWNEMDEQFMMREEDSEWSDDDSIYIHRSAITHYRAQVLLFAHDSDNFFINMDDEYVYAYYSEEPDEYALTFVIINTFVDWDWSLGSLNRELSGVFDTEDEGEFELFAVMNRDSGYIEEIFYSYGINEQRLELAAKYSNWDEVDDIDTPEGID